MRRGWAGVSVALLALAACAAPQNVSSVTPNPSGSAEASPSQSPSSSPTSPVALASLPLHAGEVGISYTPVTFTAKGGIAPYSWSAVSTPPGMVLSPAGVVSGNPTVAGSYTLTVTVSDSAGGNAIGHASMVVYSQLAATELCASPKCIVGKGCTKCGKFGTATKGLGPYTYRVVGGAIPKGMRLSGLSLLGGFPIGSSSLSVMVTDKLGAQMQVDASWSVYGPAALIAGRTSDTCSNNNQQPVSCSATWSFSGGNTTVLPKLAVTGYLPYCPATGCYPTPTGPPPGWAVSVKSGTVTLAANSTACVTNYTGYITFVLRDQSSCATTSSSNTGKMLVDLRYSC